MPQTTPGFQVLDSPGGGLRENRTEVVNQKSAIGLPVLTSIVLPLGMAMVAYSDSLTALKRAE